MASVQYQKPIILECGYYHTDSALDNKCVPRLVRDYEIDFNLSGGRTMWVNDISYLITAGSVVCRCPGQMVYSSGVYNMYTLTLAYSQTTLPKSNIRNTEHTAQVQDASYYWETLPTLFEPQHASEISKLYRKLISEYHKCGQNDVCDLLVAQLLHQLLADAYANNNTVACQNSSAVDTVIQHMTANYETEISLDELSGLVHLNKSYLIRLFKKEIGLTPMEYLSKIRIQQSRWYLIKSDETISGISERCGFHRSAYNIARFKQEYGITPHQYRKQFSRMSNQG